MGSLNKLNKLKTGVINKLADKVAKSGNSEGAERIRAGTRNQRQAPKAVNPTSSAGQNSGVGRLNQATSPINTTLGKKIKAL
jgi:hypothetical protein